MAKSMDEKLHSLKSEKDAKEANAAPAEKVLATENEEVQEGTNVTVGETTEVDPDDLKAVVSARPKPVPKKDRKGSKKLQAELEAAQELAEANKDKYTRLLAEFDNARTRAAKENAAMFDMGAKDALEKLLPVVDNFERALATLKDDEKNGFSEGIEKIYRQLMEELAKLGATPMNCEGQEFDPNFHNAVMHVEGEKYGENVVVEEMQKGYMYKDTVLRHAMVKVAN